MMENVYLSAVERGRAPLGKGYGMKGRKDGVGHIFGSKYWTFWYGLFLAIGSTFQHEHLVPNRPRSREPTMTDEWNEPEWQGDFILCRNLLTFLLRVFLCHFFTFSDKLSTGYWKARSSISIPSAGGHSFGYQFHFKRSQLGLWF